MEPKLTVCPILGVSELAVDVQAKAFVVGGTTVTDSVQLACEPALSMTVTESATTILPLVWFV